jgi:probable DNA repair protein
MTDPVTAVPELRVDHPGLYRRLQAGHLLVTGNLRLARVLREGYKQWRIDAGDSRWPSPAVRSWDAWLDETWEAASLVGAAGTERGVPGRRQLLSIWEQILRDSPLAGDLLHPGSLAAELRDARRLVVEWQIDLDHPAWFGPENENHAAFMQWNREFDKRCDRAGWIAPEDRITVLGQAAGAGMLSPSEPLDLLGFDEFSPQQAKLLSAMLDNGAQLHRLKLQTLTSSAGLWESKDAQQELQQMARWARYWLEQNPRSRIGIVAPDLPAARSEIERHLARTLVPAREPGDRRGLPWNISAGQPLLRYPMIETAFDLMELLSHTVSIQQLARVLRSPWIRGGLSESGQRALLEKRLRRKYPRELRADDARYRATEPTPGGKSGAVPEPPQAPPAWHCPMFAVILDRLAVFGRRHNQPAAPSDWAEGIDGLLAAGGWPSGDGAANSDEVWQTLQAWRECLHELASLDATVSALGREEAIGQLQRICRERIFQPKTPQAPVQVLGLYEANGQRFDHLWVLGLHHGNWPPPARPNPFIPNQLQAQAGLPHASPQRELEVSRTVTRRLLDCAPDCLFSYPGLAEGEEVLPSPLLAELPRLRQEDIPAWAREGWTERLCFAPGPVSGPLAMPGRLASPAGPRGGSSILKNQALCPFRAFAANRLLADGLEAPTGGISPALHGSLLHRALERFWRETTSHAGLSALDGEALRDRVRGHVKAVLEREPGLRRQPALRTVEADRLLRHMLSFLELELQRQPFEVIGIERELVAEIEGQPIRLVLDRVDRSADGEQVIIDYKTGKVQPGQWFGSRPEEPQLPLYANTADPAPTAVAMAVIREDGCEFKGVSQREGLLPGLPPKATKSTEFLVEAGRDMPQTIARWREALQTLMADFLAGEAAVDPKHGRRTCQESYCTFQSLCRINELDQAPDAEEPA